MPVKVLIVDDEASIRDMLVFSLSRAKMETLTAQDAQAALAVISDNRPDIVLLDWMMPGTNGIELARRLRADAATRDLPIIMLTARSTENDRVNGLETGCDDYILKPFSPRELIARIKSLLRRTALTPGEKPLQAGKLQLDVQARRILTEDKEIQLAPTEYRLLEFFIRHPNRAYSRSQLLDQVWGGNVYVEERTVDVHIRRVRKILQELGLDNYIQTVRGFGYRFSSDMDT
ncbi:MAG: phosphate regulon transcriptional regulator PhoB [Xanthomonadales bacterium]|nr:phosphate regulon transcriptional regulator PhoB [Xanthomonadales bacterium]